MYRMGKWPQQLTARTFHEYPDADQSGHEDHSPNYPAENPQYLSPENEQDDHAEQEEQPTAGHLLVTVCFVLPERPNDPKQKQ